MIKTLRKSYFIFALGVLLFNSLLSLAQESITRDTPLVRANTYIKEAFMPEQLRIIELWNTALTEYSPDLFPQYWSGTDLSFVKFPQYEIGMIYLEHRNWENMNATVLSVQQKDDIYILKTAFVDDDSNIIAIYNVVVAEEMGELRFFNYFRYFQGKYKLTQYNEIEYYSSKDYSINLEKAEEMHLFNVYLADFFETDLIPYKYYIFENSEQMFRDLGFDYNIHMFDTFQKAGEADINFNTRGTTIFAGNNSEFFPHEAVHVYLTTLYGHNVHRFFDEGMAAWLGGSFGKSFEYQMNFLKQYIQNNVLDLNGYPEKYYILSYDINTKDSINGLICKLVCEQKGMEGLKELFLAGKTDEDFYKAVEAAFNIDRSEFDTFIKNQIRAYQPD